MPRRQKQTNLSIILGLAIQLSACADNSGAEPEPPVSPIPSISLTSVTANEGNSGTVEMVFGVTLSTASTDIVSVDYAMSDDSASSGVDYQPASGSLLFDPGISRQTIEVTIQGDTDIEAGETLFMTLSAPVNATLLQGSATGSIINDDYNSGIPGIDNRPDNQTCVAPARPITDASVAVIDPLSEYPRSLGNSITGGYVYRGSAIPELIGRYVFADVGSGRFWALLSDGQGGYSNDQLIDTDFGPTSFGVDQDAET